MSFFNLTEIQPSIAKSHIREIILYRRINVSLSLHIISNCAVNQEGITEIINFRSFSHASVKQLQPVFQNIIQLIHTNLKYWEIIKTIAIKQSVFHNRICHISPHCFVFFYFTVSKYPIIPMHTSFFIGDHSVCNFILYI